MRIYFLTLSILLCFTLRSEAVIAVSSPSSEWTAVIYQGDADPTGDQQTAGAGNEADIVGDATSAALYKIYDGVNFGLRLRLGGEDNANQGYQSAAIIGLDVTQDGILDYYIAASIDGVGAANDKLDIGIYAFPGGAISPSTTTLASPSADLFGYEQSSANFSWSAVSTIDPGLTPYLNGSGDLIDPYNVDGTLDKGDPIPDFFITFVVPFSDMVTAFGNGFGEETPISFVAITSQNLNQTNNDFNGIDDSPESLGTPYGGDPDGSGGGAGSLPYTVESESPVPESAAYALLLGLATLGCAASRRRR